MAKRALIPGTDWTPAIVNALNSSRLMLLIHSASANRSKHVFRETQLAFEKGTTVIPIKIDGSDSSGEMQGYRM
jgi:hypothetical protein